jgi:hypothetical protein
MTNTVQIKRFVRGESLGEVGDLFEMFGKPVMLIGIPYGPDSDHLSYNLLSLEDGTAISVGHYESIKDLMDETGPHLTRIDGYVVISKEKS